MAELEIILAADTSTRHCAIALCRFARSTGALKVMAQSIVDRHRLHAESLLEGIHGLYEAAGCSLEQTTVLAVTSGPGSFTGLRVGLATWKGLAFALNLPLVSVPTLDAMARLVPIVDGVVIPLLDARMNEVFGAVYQYSGALREKIIPDCVCPVQDFLVGDYMEKRPIYLLGDGAWRYEPQILELAPQVHIVPEPCGTPRADVVALEAGVLLLAGVCTDPVLAVPRYLRASQAEQARAVRREDMAPQCSV
jgi:tRNA threonylcarbamoyladenosine biosynthesis protein TsaB